MEQCIGVNIVGDRQQCLVAFSGGWDSTAVLLTLLSRGRHVRTAYVKNNKYFEGTAIELKARERILARIARMCATNILPGSLHYDTITTTDLYMPHMDDNCLIMQPTIISIMAGMVEEDEDLYYGYISGDTVWTVKAEMDAIHNAIFTMRDIKDKVGVYFPFGLYRKTDVLDMVAHYGMANYISTCERPNLCGNTSAFNKKCHKCQTQILDKITYNKMSYQSLTSKNKAARVEITTTINKYMETINKGTTR